MNDIAFILAQVIGLVTGIMGVLTLCMKKRKTFLYGTCLKGFVNIWQLVLLKESAVIPVVLVEIVRNFLYTKTKKKWIPVVFITIMVSLCILMYDGVKLGLLIFGYTTSSIFYMCQDIKKIKIFQAFTYIVWLPWDISIMNYAKVVCHIVAIGIVVYQVLISDKRSTAREDKIGA